MSSTKQIPGTASSITTRRELDLIAETQPSLEARDHRLQVGIIGFGYWGPQLARNFDRLRLAKVARIADLSEERRHNAEWEHPGARVTSAADEVLNSDVDAVVIATPIRTHFALAMAALEQGKHVFVEKPLTHSAATGRALIEAARGCGRVLMVGHTFMYNPAVEELRRLVQSDGLGRVYYVEAVRANLGLFQNDINVIWDLAPHDLSILDYVLGAPPLRVSAHGGAYVQPDIHDVAHVTLYYPHGVLAHIHASWLSPSKIRRFTIVGDRQMVVYDDVEATEKIRVFNRGIDRPAHTSTFGEFQLSYRYGDIVSPHIHWSEPLALECRHFVEAILEGKAPRSDGYNGLRIVRILEAIEASLMGGGVLTDIPQEEELPDEE